MDEDKEESYAAQDVLSLGWLLAHMLTSQDLSTVSFCPLPSTKRCIVPGLTLFVLALWFVLAFYLGLACSFACALRFVLKTLAACRSDLRDARDSKNLP